MVYIVSAKVPFAAFVAAALAAVSLSACVPNIDQRGNLPERDKLAEIHPGATTRDQVAKILGTPSSTGIFDDKRWYYVSRKTKQVAFLDPDVLDQQVYIVNFNGQGVVQSVDHRGMKDGRDIAMAPGATPAPGRELTFIEQILGNIGRFNRSSAPASTGPEQRAPGPLPHDKY